MKHKYTQEMARKIKKAYQKKDGASAVGHFPARREEASMICLSVRI
jgi:hypothetical protein